VNRIKHKKKPVFFPTRAGKRPASYSVIISGKFLLPGFFLAISNFRSYNFKLYVNKQIKNDLQEED